jgi:glycosyltransferase involved in cell wall biosynthesis
VLRAIEWRRSSLYTSRSFAAADLINVPNDDERRALERRRLAAKVVVLPNALPRSSLDALAAIADGPRPDPPRALVIGSWTYRKGIADWPAILARLWERIPAARVCFAGAGVPEAQVRADLGVGADPRVEVAPAYAPEELPALLAHATAGALASYVEGFGLGVLETLAAGRPCVSYDVPGPRDLAGAVNRGWLVPVGEAAALADRLADVLEHELAHPGETAAACVHFARRFGWDTVGAATVEAYERGLERLKRPGPRGPASPGRS